MKKLGFIGMGNMAQALCQGFIASGLVAAADVYAFAPNQEKLKANAGKFGFTPCETLSGLLEKVDTVVMACKPYQIYNVLAEAGNGLEGKTMVSVALGWDFAKYAAALKTNTRIQFVMPNTPAMVGEGMLLFEDENSLEDEERKQIIELFSSVGKVCEMPSHLMGIGGAISGCGPAFVDLMMEAYADAAVKYGVPRKQAYELVGQTLLGSAKLMLETGEHPGVLKDNVCSPGGSTIKGVDALEKAGFRAACIESIDAIMGVKKD